MRKELNKKVGALKRKFKTGSKDFEPGTFINKAKDAQKAKKVAIMGG